LKPRNPVVKSLNQNPKHGGKHAFKFDRVKGSKMSAETYVVCRIEECGGDVTQSDIDNFINEWERLSE
jgi:hypothetical protein